MARFERLAKEVFAKKQGRPRNAYLEEYVGYLTDLAVGEGGEITMESGEKKATIKNRLTKASAAANVNLKYLRTSGERVRFQVID